MKEKEEDYYNQVKETLELHFSLYGLKTDFEITAEKKIPCRFLKSDILKKQKTLLPMPDIMGLVWRNKKEYSKLVIAEFKIAPTFRDIFQTKGYAELYNADITFLISKTPFSKNYKRIFDFLKATPHLLKVDCKKQIYIRFLHKVNEGPPTLAILGNEIEIFPLDDLIDTLFLQ